MSPIVGLAGICWGIYFVATHEAKGFKGGYYDLPAVILLGVLPPCILLLSHSFKDFFTGFGALLSSIFGGKSRAQREVIETLTQAAAMVRSEGLGALMRIRNRVSYELLRDGFSLIVNNFTPEEIRHNLQAKINAKQSRLELAANLFENMAKVSPGVGLFGSLLGLIAMMANLSDPSKIGGGMALSLIATLYGVLLGNFIYGPMGERISLEADKSLELDLMVMEGVLSLKGKKSSVHLNDIMKTYANTAAKGRR